MILCLSSLSILKQGSALRIAFDYSTSSSFHSTASSSSGNSRSTSPSVRHPRWTNLHWSRVVTHALRLALHLVTQSPFPPVRREHVLLPNASLQHLEVNAPSIHLVAEALGGPSPPPPFAASTCKTRTPYRQTFAILEVKGVSVQQMPESRRRFSSYPDT